ncbi:unnamed protein product [Protopolystoma xenopodis]|uniref:Uncharacterized protein n=1 Tax=Protopolystoma xenopodis TaxID=117903 RepID=A0A3S5FD02_9PLAT|nr:unnamed protein product [Protopolystoma xenopodis]
MALLLSRQLTSSKRTDTQENTLTHQHSNSLGGRLDVCPMGRGWLTGLHLRQAFLRNRQMNADLFSLSGPACRRAGKVAFRLGDMCEACPVCPVCPVCPARPVRPDCPTWPVFSALCILTPLPSPTLAPAGPSRDDKGPVSSSSHHNMGQTEDGLGVRTSFGRCIRATTAGRSPSSLGLVVSHLASDMTQTDCRS